ncbi:AAA+ ATPase domain-containing protein [Cynara cardunculus var. scolymus]|uniref:AAA+ ATPase domain-containing protein n=1 Tax=Cynara cardunculus var. scolymus TaxID=59895 RepID=A0A103Y127_CYNCS|nr:AAA+ ATPase domain-containing protein [Cynara cardunculus var. scolymus]
MLFDAQNEFPKSTLTWRLAEGIFEAIANLTSPEMVEVVIGCAGNLIAKIGEKLIAETRRHLGYVLYYHNYVESLKQQVEKLMVKSEGITLEVEEARRNGDVVAPEVEQWFTSVEVIYEESMRFLEIEVRENKGILNGWFPDIKKRYILSKKAKRKTQKAATLKAEVFHKISYPAPPLAVGDRSIGDFRNFESRIPIIDQLMKLLKDDTKQIISICGMGGSGKTTMVKEVARRVQGEKLFDEITMAVVSKEHNLMKVQEDLAKWLGLRFKATTLEGRANELWRRLLQSRKGNLVILDDIWKHIDLKNIGIPFGKEYKNCKVILTSRSKDACKAMGCEDVLLLDILTPSEAWSLLGEMVGDDLQDDPDLCEIASEIAKKCGGLPIAIVCLGRALKDKRKEVWKDTLLKLQRSVVPTNIEGVKEDVYQSLQASYDLLEDEEAKKLFLLCCLYPEYANVPLEALVRCGFGLEFFKHIDFIIQARDRVHALTDKLRSRFLLLSGDRKSTVKVHNVVRAVGISVASRLEPNMEQFSAVVMHEDKWPRGMTYGQYKAVSVVSNEISELPSRGLSFQKLELLQLACPKLSLEKLNTMFETMKKVRVVELWNLSLLSFSSILSSLPRDIFALSMDCKMETIGDIKTEEFVNLEILSLGNCDITELPMEIGKFANLRLLDMSGCRWLERISPGVISNLSQLEELDTGSKWWGDEEEGDTSLTELESLTNLKYLGIRIKSSNFLPKKGLFEKLQRYVISVGVHLEKSRSFNKRILLLKLEITDRHLGGGIDKLLRMNTEIVFLTGDGIKTALKELVPSGFQQVKNLTVECCNSEGTEYLSDSSYTSNSAGVFTNLEKLRMEKMWHLRGILRHDGQGLPIRSFSRLRKIHLSVLPVITYLFTQSVATNLVHLESLRIEYCTNMEQVIFNPRPSALASTIENKIVFPKLSELILNYVSLACFSHGLNLQVEFPQLTVLKLEYLPNFHTFCPEEINPASKGNLKGTNFHYLVDNKVTFPSLETLELSELDSVEELWSSQLPTSQFGKLKSLRVEKCHKLINIFPSELETLFPSLEKLDVEKCDSLEQVWGSEGVQIRNLKSVFVSECPKLRNLCSFYTFKGLPNLQILDVSSCKMMEEVVEDEHKNEKMKEVVSLGKLEEVKLAFLPNLNYFSHTKCDMEMAELTQVIVKNCPEMHTFSGSSVTTPKLKFLDGNIPGSVKWKTFDIEERGWTDSLCSARKLKNTYFTHNEHLRALK